MGGTIMLRICLSAVGLLATTAAATAGCGKICGAGEGRGFGCG